MKKILQPIYVVYVLLVSIVTVLPTLPFFVVLIFVFRKNVEKQVHNLVKKWATVWFWCMGMPVKRIGKMPQGTFVIVANHCSYLDALVIFPAIPVYFKPLGKKEIADLPIIGFVYKCIVVMVDRGSQQSRAKSVKMLWQALQNNCNIVIFPEGTFNESDAPLKNFYDGAFKLAINAQVPILPLIIPDTINRWHYSAWWHWTPGKNRALFLPPVATKNMTQENMNTLKQNVYKLMEAELIKYK